MRAKVILFLILIGGAAAADQIDVLKNISDVGCKAAFATVKQQDLGSFLITKCNNEALKLSKIIINSNKTDDQDKISLVTALCNEFRSPTKQYACYVNTILNSNVKDLLQLHNYTLAVSENYLKTQKPIYIYETQQQQHTLTGEMFFQVKYAWWMKGLLKDYASTDNADVNLIINKHPDVSTQGANLSMYSN